MDGVVRICCKYLNHIIIYQYIRLKTIEVLVCCRCLACTKINQGAKVNRLCCIEDVERSLCSIFINLQIKLG